MLIKTNKTERKKKKKKKKKFLKRKTVLLSSSAKDFVFLSKICSASFQNLSVMVLKSYLVCELIWIRLGLIKKQVKI
jgi:hypothetical protein